MTQKYIFHKLKIAYKSLRVQLGELTCNFSKIYSYIGGQPIKVKKSESASNHQKRSNSAAVNALSTETR